MATFVHLTSEKNIKAITHSGIKPGRPRGVLPKGVFAVPVTPDFYGSHQWLRELRRSGQRTLCAVYLRIPDDEPVYVGHYNEHHQVLTAAEAVANFLQAQNSDGCEVLISRKVRPGEIQQVRHLPQVVGWRYRPDSHAKPFCGCIMCIGLGTIRSRQKNRAWEAKFNQ